MTFVPQELLNRRQWICWRSRRSPGKAKDDKLPVCARTGLGDGFLKTENHVSYEEAVAAMARWGASGVGFVLVAGCGVIGGDLDNCRNPQTGALDAWAQDIIDHAETYFEVSPSGTGLRFWALGALPNGPIKNAEAGVELYDRGRYLTFTARQVGGTPDEIAPATNNVIVLEDRVKARKGAQAQSPGAAGQGATLAQWVYQQTPYGRVNQAALRRLDEWVPDLFPTAELQPGTKAWRIKSVDLGRPELEEDLSISPEGGKDFGLHDMGDARGGKRSPIDIVLEWHPLLSTKEEAVEWLAETLNIPFGDATAKVDAGAELDDCFDAGDEDGKIPPRQWLLGTTFCREFLGGLISAGAGGKTTVRIAQCLALASGRPITGEHIFMRARVMIVCLEDDMKELRRRVLAARLHHGISAAEVKGYLILTTPRGLKIAQLDGKGGVVPGGLLNALEKAVDRYSLDLICIDPAVKAHGVEENNNNQIDVFASILADLSVRRNISVDLLAHERKGGANGVAAGDADRSRGASALRDAERLAKTLTGMTQEEANQFGVNGNEKRLLTRLDNAKVNIAPPSASATWFKLVDVAIGNATEAYPHGDHVQTVERWTPPDAFQGMDTDGLNEVLRKLDAGMDNGQRYSTANAAGKRAAWKAVQAQFPNAEEGPCRSVIRQWKKNGMFVEEEYYDKIENQKRTGIASAQLIDGCK